MDKATELAHRIIPLADSEWPMTPEGRAIAVEHAATIIRSALADERERCAKVAEEIGEKHLQWSKMNLPVEPSPIIAKDRADVAKRIAAAIRARGR